MGAIAKHTNSRSVVWCKLATPREWSSGPLDDLVATFMLFDVSLGSDWNRPFVSGQPVVVTSMRFGFVMIVYYIFVLLLRYGWIALTQWNTQHSIMRPVNNIEDLLIVCG